MNISDNLYIMKHSEATFVTEESCSCCCWPFNRNRTITKTSDIAVRTIQASNALLTPGSSTLKKIFNGKEAS